MFGKHVTIDKFGCDLVRGNSVVPKGAHSEPCLGWMNLNFILFQRT